MECEKIKDLMIKKMEEVKKNKEIVLHLKECKGCSDFFNYLLYLNRLMSEIPVFEPNEHVFKRIKNKIVWNKILSIFTVLYFLSVVPVLYLIIIFISRFGIFYKISELFVFIFKFKLIFPLIIKFGIAILIPLLLNIFTTAILIFVIKKFIFKKGSIPLLKANGV